MENRTHAVFPPYMNVRKFDLKLWSSHGPTSKRHSEQSHVKRIETLHKARVWSESSSPFLMLCTVMIEPKHDDVMKWKHFPRYLSFVRTGHRWIPLTRPVTRSLDVFFDLRPNKRLSKQSWGWWFETPSRSLWRHCKGINLFPMGRGPEQTAVEIGFYSKRNGHPNHIRLETYNK